MHDDNDDDDVHVAERDASIFAATNRRNNNRHEILTSKITGISPFISPARNVTHDKRTASAKSSAVCPLAPVSPIAPPLNDTHPTCVAASTATPTRVPALAYRVAANAQGCR